MLKELKMSTPTWRRALRWTFSIGLVILSNLQPVGGVKMYFILSKSSSARISFKSKSMSIGFYPNEFVLSRIAPENISSFTMFLTFSKALSSSKRVFKARWMHVFPSMSYALGSAPSFISACTFFIKWLMVAKCSAVAPLSSTKLTSIL